MDVPFERGAFFIGGQWMEPSPDSGAVSVIEAATENVLGNSPLAGLRDIDAAVAAARQGLSGPWGRFSGRERADLMRNMAAALETRATSTANLVSRENGMPRRLSLGSNGYAPSLMLNYYAGLGETINDDDVRIGTSSRTTVTREPVGVVAAITPWNYPMGISAMKIAPALAAGCTVILKPPPETALDAFVWADAALEAGLPPGVLNVVPGDRKAGAHLVAHVDIDKVSFTGSTSAGRNVGETCGRLLRPVTLELGGKSAAILAEDVDLEEFLQALPDVCLPNNGQTCHASTRILAPISRYSEVVDAITDTVRRLRIGDPLDKATIVGPLVSEAQRDRVLDYIDLGVRQGATMTAGGKRSVEHSAGWFVEPTVLTTTDNSIAVAQHEIFGPVLCVIPYTDEGDAITIANQSEYGLGGTVWTADPERGMQIARQIRTGTFGINHYALDVTSPFGGVKSSGIGRELGPEGLVPYLVHKSIYERAHTD
jgi:aldehyde dehydrogenase (NAD+)